MSVATAARLAMPYFSETGRPSDIDASTPMSHAFRMAGMSAARVQPRDMPLQAVHRSFFYDLGVVVRLVGASQENEMCLRHFPKHQAKGASRLGWSFSRRKLVTFTICKPATPAVHPPRTLVVGVPAAVIVPDEFTARGNRRANRLEKTAYQCACTMRMSCSRMYRPKAFNDPRSTLPLRRKRWRGRWRC